jgi:cystathionine beta-lyase
MSERFGPGTRLTRAGRRTGDLRGAPVNPAPARASTLLFSDPDDLYREDIRTYGLEGLDVQDALRAALAEIEGGTACTLVPSGLAACTLALMSVLKGGDHLLVTDSVYGPTRRFCDGLLARFGVETQYFDPQIGSGIANLIRPTTAAIMLESPGSLTLEVMDIPAIVGAARAAGVLTLLDNTWSAGVLFRPFEHGIAISIQAATKFQSGHSDALVGACITRDPALAARLARTNKELGMGVSPDEAALVLRGLRTMGLRMARQAASADAVLGWLAQQPEVAAILAPQWPGSPGHALWRRDFAGAAGLFSFVLTPTPPARLNAFLRALRVIGMGFSWGGYESLIIPCDPQLKRMLPLPDRGPLLRLSVGLEDPEDLIADLARGFDALRAG